MSCRSRGSLGGTCHPPSPPTGSRVTSPGSPEMGVNMCVCGCRCVCVLGVGVCVLGEGMCAQRDTERREDEREGKERGGGGNNEKYVRAGVRGEVKSV